MKTSLSTFSDKMFTFAIAAMLVLAVCVNFNANAQEYTTASLNELAYESALLEKIAPTEMLVTEKAQFVGNKQYKDINSYLRAHISYPETGVMTGTYGVLKLSIEILENGEVGEIEILESPDPAFDEEVLDAIADMPNWIPALNAGKAVSSKQLFLLKFRLQ